MQSSGVHFGQLYIDEAAFKQRYGRNGDWLEFWQHFQDWTYQEFKTLEERVGVDVCVFPVDPDRFELAIRDRLSKEVTSIPGMNVTSTSSDVFELKVRDRQTGQFIRENTFILTDQRFEQLTRLIFIYARQAAILKGARITEF